MDPRISIVEGDITELAVDAIVNAANESLIGRAGVAAAIQRAAGPGLIDELREVGGCPTGEARATGGHDLPARWIIHAVGPVWHGGDRGEDGLLADCYLRSLGLAEELGARTIAFPLISAGVFGYPFERAVWVALSAIDGFLAHSDAIEAVLIVCFGSDSHQKCLSVSRKLASG